MKNVNNYHLVNTINEELKETKLSEDAKIKAKKSNLVYKKEDRNRIILKKVSPEQWASLKKRFNPMIYRSSRPESFNENFAKFTGKYLCQSLFLIKLQAEACDFIKKTLAQVFSLWIFRNF